MIPAHHTAVVLTEDGKLTVDHLPFKAGEAVEVIVVAVTPLPLAPQPLRGSVIRYDDPTAPVADSDWSAAQ